MNQAVSLLELRLTTRALRSLAPIRQYVNAANDNKAALAHVIRSTGLYAQGEFPSPPEVSILVTFRTALAGDADDTPASLPVPGLRAPGSDRQKRLIDALGNPEPPKAPEPAASTDSMEVESTATDKPAETESATATASTSNAATAPATKKERKKADPNALPKEIASTLPEADAYLSLLVLLSLLDAKSPQAQEYAAKEIEYFAQMNRRTMDQLASKFYFYWVRAHELAGDDVAALRP